MRHQVSAAERLVALREKDCGLTHPFLGTGGVKEGKTEEHGACYRIHPTVERFGLKFASRSDEKPAVSAAECSRLISLRS